MSRLLINTDGGSRGNPGPAAIGVVFCDLYENVLYEYMQYIGEATNNEAEYRAVIKALDLLLKSEWIKTHNNSDGEAIFRLDSKLVVEQLNGNYKIKQPHIQKFIENIQLKMDNLKLKIVFIHVPREENKLADKLVNKALDKEIKANA